MSIGFLTFSCQAKKDTMKIGAVLPLSGDAAQWGVAAKQGIQIAVDEVNANGGIDGQNVVVIFEDSQLQPRVGSQAMQKLSTVDKVPAVIGAISSSVTLAMAPIAERNQVVLISPASTSHDISDAGDFVFRTIPADIYEGGYLGNYSKSQLGFNRVAIIAVNAAGTEGMAEAFRDAFTKSGGEITVFELVPQGATDFRATVSKAIATRPEAAYVVGFPLETGHLIKQLKELGYSGQVLSAQPAEDPEVRNIAGSAAEGIVFTTTTIDEESGTAATKSFTTAYRKRFGKSPGIFSYEAYDAAQLILAAIKESGASGPSIRDFLYSVKDYEGASGKFSFNENGDVDKSIRIVTVNAGQVISYNRKAD